MLKWLSIIFMVSCHVALANGKPDDIAYLYPQIGIHDGNHLRLLDVVRVSDDLASELLLADKIVVLDETSLEQIRQTGVITKAQLAAYLNVQVKGFDRVKLIGPEKIRLEFREKHQPVNEVKALALSSIAAHLDARFTKGLVVEYVGPERSLYFNTNAQLIATVKVQTPALPKRVQVMFVESQGTRVRHRAVWFEVNYQLQVLALKGDVLAKQDLSYDQVVSVWKDNHDIAVDVITDASALKQRFIGDYQAGRIITASMLENIPAVDYGQQVAVAVNMGNVRIETRGIALQTAEIGDNISIESLSSGETFMAKVIDRGIVLVQDI